eukprot:CAMPEP_0201970982 /NCGR_PEP_ID=MMETSP0904-20121228/34787_1 /ASSEMBLY_ACC=CAM_ASM_000553 /TAXON_ID=420261 /ORGANISM="Thalassiosira antarctica, Strain CCMP982" /LENGTH=54 /DNA_ID=CAMNT_0048520211 /DNA_START=9 /DNA_END=169 /DNA_ORIENTATION=+
MTPSRTVLFGGDGRCCLMDDIVPPPPVVAPAFPKMRFHTLNFGERLDSPHSTLP